MFDFFFKTNYYQNMTKNMKVIVINSIATLVSMTVLAAFVAFPVWFLWGQIASTFDLPVISLWQAFLVNLLWNVFTFFKINKDDVETSAETIELEEVTDLEDEGQQ